ncbi:prepilin-type N-terminal cleavage/methylation domain-containing protein [bacterium]|nr:prepilin-type N-terminal cleavage/methylation domain-containing protein [bacterium]MCI0605527.1 prepilin-type N-terminal cleavage/methylation domain-containing protein [bacterium]
MGTGSIKIKESKLRRRDARATAGFTLIELLVAVLILAVGALALAQLFASSVWVNARTKDDTEIYTVAEQVLEDLYDSRYANLPVGGDLNTAQSGYSIASAQLESSVIVSDPTQFHPNAVVYSVFWKITDAGSIAGVPLKEIAVRVVSKRLQMGAKGRETIVRTQIASLF